MNFSLTVEFSWANVERAGFYGEWVVEITQSDPTMYVAPVTYKVYDADLVKAMKKAADKIESLIASL